MTALMFAATIAPSLADPDESSALVAAVRWIEGVALGTIATSIALIAVASVALLTLTGRLPVRRGATVIVGCFVLFGAPIIAAGLLETLRIGPRDTAIHLPAPPASPLALPLAKSTPAYDPYSGAAVPQR